MVDFNKNTLAIVISDIHIGNEYSRIEEFTAFLDKILLSKSENQLPFLRALIILGAFFDLLATSFEDICSNSQYFGIYDALDKIMSYNIEVILVLGNHEISTSWFYNLQFSSRKREFIRQFGENHFNYNFFIKENFCQYLVLTDYENSIYLLLFDSIHDEPFKAIYLANASFSNGECYFMAHGNL